MYYPSDVASLAGQERHVLRPILAVPRTVGSCVAGRAGRSCTSVGLALKLPEYLFGVSYLRYLGS